MKRIYSTESVWELPESIFYLKSQYTTIPILTINLHGKQRTSHKMNEVPLGIFTLKFITKCKVFSEQKKKEAGNWLPIQHIFFSFMINDHLYSNINKNSFKSRKKTRINANISFQLPFVEQQMLDAFIYIAAMQASISV